MVSAWVELARLFLPRTLEAFLLDPANGFECIRQPQAGSVKGILSFRVSGDIAIIGQPLAKSYYSGFSEVKFATSTSQPTQGIEDDDFCSVSSQVEGQQEDPLTDSKLSPFDCVLVPDAATEDADADSEHYYDLYMQILDDDGDGTC